MSEQPLITQTIGETASGLPWPVSTSFNGLAKVDGFGRVHSMSHGIHGVAPAVARGKADELVRLAGALRIAADWAEEHADELRGYDR